MKLAIMQPYFFPYLGYFALIKHSDQFILFDNVQYIRHGWINRNRILKPGSGWQYFIVPLEKHSREVSIKDIIISSTEDWRKRILGQIEHYKKIAPNYIEVKALLEDCFSQNSNNITKLNAVCLQKTCHYLNIDFNFSVFSELKMDLEEIHAPDEWALFISKRLGISEYINSQDGILFFDRKKYADNNITLSFLKVNITEYPQFRNQFEPSLSIIDVLMFNDKKQVLTLLDNISYL
jgi:hypothetical protein